MASVLSSLRYLFADLLGEDDDAPPFLPDGLSEDAVPIVSDGIDLLISYQGPRYAQLYVDRLRRFVGRPHVDSAILCEIARLLALRMAYEDPIRIAQLKLAEPRSGKTAPGRPTKDVWKFRLDELICALPQAAAAPLLTSFERIRLSHRLVPVRFSTRRGMVARRLKVLAVLRRWRLHSVRYAEERAWVERWLHMIARCLDKQPASTSAVVATAAMIQGHGSAYRQGLADWHAIIDGLAKPTFDGVLPLADLAAAIEQARKAAVPDPHQAALKRTIAELRAGALAPGRGAAAE